MIFGKNKVIAINNCKKRPSKDGFKGNLLAFLILTTAKMHEEATLQHTMIMNQT